jgi:hypothetical protein
MSLQSLLVTAKQTTLSNKLGAIQQAFREAEQEVSQYSEQLTYNPAIDPREYSNLIMEYRAQRYGFHMLQFLLDIIPNEAENEAAAIRSYLSANNHAAYINSSLNVPSAGVVISPGPSCTEIIYQL